MESDIKWQHSFAFDLNQPPQYILFLFDNQLYIFLKLKFSFHFIAPA